MGIKNIYELLNEYTKEEIDIVLETLDSSAKRLLYLRYGSDLEHPDTSHWNPKYQTKFYRILLPKIRELLKFQREKEVKSILENQDITIYQVLNGYPKEEIDDAIEKLNIREKQLLYARFGYDLNNPDVSRWDAKYNQELISELIPRLRFILEENRKLKKEKSVTKKELKVNLIDFKGIKLNLYKFDLKLIEIINNILESEEYTSLLNQYQTYEIVIALLLKRLYDTYDYDLKDILEIFNISIEELKRINKEIVPLLVKESKMI